MDSGDSSGQQMRGDSQPVIDMAIPVLQAQ
jgi:hypothetical protein